MAANAPKRNAIYEFLHGVSLHNLADITISVRQIKNAVAYLQHYGYLSQRLIQNPSFKDITKAVKKFQKLFSLKSDGVIGPITLRAMASPRCGCFDIYDPQSAAHREQQQVKQFAKERMSRWRKSGLTYAVRGYVKGTMSKTAQLRTFQQAFDSWANVTNLKINAVRDPKKADLLINVGRGKKYSFDGAGGTLAWAYLPNDRNTQLLMRFDLDENWVKDTKSAGIILLNVAAHEFGHMLGLTHSNKKGALMAPYYNATVAVPQPVDDILRIQKLYGTKVKPTVESKPKPSEFKLVCSNLQVVGYSLVRNDK